MRTGKCLRCGRCCTFYALWKTLNWKEKAMLYLMRPKLLWIDRKFNCPHLVIADNKYSCLIHKNKPNFCREFPASKEDLIDHCGYKFYED